MTDIAGCLKPNTGHMWPSTDCRTRLRTRRSAIPSPGDQGSITIFVVVFFLSLLATAGLVVDGGAKLRAAREASAVAEEAARAGASRVNRDQAYADGGSFVIDRTSAVAAASAYLSTSGNTGSVAMTSARSIRVTVTINKPTLLLSLIGIGEVHATKSATADLLQGIGGENR
jgi:uncharacterized membrane protein